MFMQLSDLQKALAQYSIALGTCIGVALLSPRLGERTPLFAMLTPVAAVLMTLLVVTRDGYSRAAWRDLAVHRLGLRAWSLALFLPLVILSFSYGCVWLSGVAQLIPPDLSGGTFSLLLDVVVSIAIVALTGAVAEEIGWRGYLLPHLKRLGLRQALLLSGFLHGFWHLPILIGTTYYHAEGNRLIIVPLFLVTLTLAGVCYGYLRLITGSVWPAAIAHSAFNIFWERLHASTFTPSALPLEYLAGESGILTVVALAIVAGWLSYRLGDGAALRW